MKKDDISLKNGKDGNASYVAYDGKVYDVTNSKMWKNGSHLNRHSAGEDLTEFMSMAPHGPEVFDKFESIGELEQETTAPDKKEMYRQLYSKYHPHPIVLHYPMGLIGFSAFMLFLFIFTQNRNFEYAAYYALICGVLTSIPTILSGILSWWINYEMTMTKIFKHKLIASTFLLFFGFLSVWIRWHYPEVALQSTPLSYTYYASVFISVPTMTVAAYNGGKITWPS